MVIPYTAVVTAKTGVKGPSGGFGGGQDATEEGEATTVKWSRAFLQCDQAVKQQE